MNDNDDFMADFKRKTATPAETARMAREHLQTFPDIAVAHAARGGIDLNGLARLELLSRCLDLDGRWVGSDEARRIHGEAEECAVTRIARERLGFEAVAAANPETGDLREWAVWNLMAALREAYAAGYAKAYAEAGTIDHRPTSPTTRSKA